MKDRGRENIKIEILRHTLLSLAITTVLIMSSLVEVFVSKKNLLFFVKYI
jgi:hypothetical protein